MSPPQPNNLIAPGSLHSSGRFFWCTILYRGPIRDALRGVHEVLDRVVRLSLQRRKNDVSAGVDSIDIIIVGLGLFLILMVLLRR